MRTSFNIKNIICMIIFTWAGIAMSGCSETNSIKALNPAAANPESSINLADPTETRSNPTKPVVNIFASRSIAGPQAEISLRAEAIDPLGQTISLAWEASEGHIISTDGANAVWKAPQTTTTAMIKCIATDARGGEGEAEIQIDVVGNSTYRLQIKADRSSLLTGRFTQDPQSPLVSIPGAQVQIHALGLTDITDNQGLVQLNIDQSGEVATSSLITVKYLNWEINYLATLSRTGDTHIIDDITFLPGYDSVSVAVARGDSFAARRGMIEIATVENSAGSMIPVAEVTVNAGSSSGIHTQKDGRALITAGSLQASETALNINRHGYHNIEGYSVPVAIDGLTLVRARLERTGSFSSLDAIISWTRPHNGQAAFPVSGPIEIGFGQPMEKNSIFNQISITAQNKRSGKVSAYSGSEIARDFDISWKNETVLQLFPKKPLEPETRYSVMLADWTARAADGRMLKNYNGLYYEFTTDADPYPRMISTTPHNGATNVGRNGPFSIKFDRPMQPDSLYDNLEIEISSLDNGASIKVNGNNIKNFFSVTWSEGNSKVELVPFMMLKPVSSYLVKFNHCNLVSESGKKASGFDNLWGQFTTGSL